MNDLIATDNGSVKAGVIHVGPSPPPFGGVSVHISRLHQLCAEHGVDVITIDSSKRLTCISRTYRILLHLLLRTVGVSGKHKKSLPVMHFHVSAMTRFQVLARYVLLATSRSVNILTIHGGAFPERVSRMPPRALQQLIKVLSRMDHIIAVSSSIRDALHERCNVPFSRISVIPAYIPGNAALRSSVPSLLPSVIDELRKRVQFVILTSGYLEPHSGFSLVVRAVAKMGRKAAVVIVGYGTRNPAVVSELTHLSASTGCVLLGPVAPDIFQALLAASNVYIRATDWDGDCVAIREALAVGTPVIASDAVIRPDGCHVFRRGDQAELIRVLTDVLIKGSRLSIHAGAFEQNPGLKILELYNTVAKRVMEKRGLR